MDHRELERRIDTFLGEFRIVVPALAALLGFQLIAAMQQTYAQLPPTQRMANFGGVVCTMLAIAFMLVPTAYHRLAPHLHEDEAFIVLSQRSLALGTLFFALSLTVSLYVQAARSFGSDVVSVAFAAGTALVLGTSWWLFPRRFARSVQSTGRDRVP